MPLTNTNACRVTSTSRVSIAALRFAGAVEFGSRALGVADEHADYDFAILRSNFEKLFEHNMPNEAPIRHYFNVAPPYGNNTLVIKYSTDDSSKIDLLVLEYQIHLDMVRRAVESINHHSTPPPWMWIKQQRINKFEQALIKQGFKRRWLVTITRWLLRPI